MPYVWPSDAWILLAVGREERNGSGGCSLEAVIETRDHFDRVVFTTAQLDEGIERLSAAGLLNVLGSQLALTSEGRGLVGRTANDDVFAAVEHVRDELREERPVADQASPQRLKEGTSARAIASYLGRN